MYGFGGVGLSEVQISISELSVVGGGGWVVVGGLDKRTSWSDLVGVRQKHCQRHNGPKALSILTQSTPLVESRSFNKIIKSWSNFSLVWFGKGRETLRSPRNNLLPCGC